jgi:hypothetical protein
MAKICVSLSFSFADRSPQILCANSPTGSALFKSVFPALISSLIYVGLLYTTDITHNEVLDDAYPMGALIAALTFILAFRANNSHSRWWEAYTTITGFHSKLLDVGSTTAAFHLQARKYDSMKPPAFGEHPDIDFVERQRIRVKELSVEELEEQLQRYERVSSFRSILGRLGLGGRVSNVANASAKSSLSGSQVRRNQSQRRRIIQVKNIGGKPSRDSVILSRKTRGIWADGQREPLFLEEAAHLLSLLSAVAFASLRNDMEEADSPLITFDPREPLPHVDPDDYKADVRKEFSGSRSRTTQIIRYLLGISRTPLNRTKYNAARPFRVIGGVSDNEVTVLRSARGNLAKVSLVFMWLEEFVSREYLAGSMGDVAPPIVSRLYQYTSDAMAQYHQARKIAYVPFPFVHAQLTSFFVLIAVGFMPILMLAFINNHAFGFFLNLVTVMSFTGLHEVSGWVLCLRFFVTYRAGWYACMLIVLPFRPLVGGPRARESLPQRPERRPAQQLPRSVQPRAPHHVLRLPPRRVLAVPAEGQRRGGLGQRHGPLPRSEPGRPQAEPGRSERRGRRRRRRRLDLEGRRGRHVDGRLERRAGDRPVVGSVVVRAPRRAVGDVGHVVAAELAVEAVGPVERTRAPAAATRAFSSAASGRRARRPAGPMRPGTKHRVLEHGHLLRPGPASVTCFPFLTANSRAFTANAYFKSRALSI